MQLDPGDLVIAYTDGIIEAANPSGEEWGVQGLLQTTAAWAPNALEMLKTSFSSSSTPWMSSPEAARQMTQPWQSCAWPEQIAVTKDPAQNRNGERYCSLRHCFTSAVHCMAITTLHCRKR